MDHVMKQGMTLDRTYEGIIQFKSISIRHSDEKAVS